MKIYYVRHGATNSNLTNKWQGLSDIDLSEVGLKQIEDLKNLTKDWVIDVIYTSPLKRALKTAEKLKKVNTQLIIDNRIIERDFGDLEQTDVQDNQKDLLANINLNTNLDSNVEKINSMYTNRIKPFLEEIKEKYKNTNKNIFIVAHSWVGRLISYYSSNEQNSELIKIAPKNAIIYEYEI